MKRRYSVYIVLLLVVLFFMGLPLSTDANCNTPIGAPHQGAAKKSIARQFHLWHIGQYQLWHPCAWMSEQTRLLYR